MATVRVTRDGISLRFGDADTPAPEGEVAAAQPPRVAVAVSPADPRARVSLLLEFGAAARVVSMRPVNRTRDEQFYEVTLGDLRPGDTLAYSVRVEVERLGGPVRLDSSEAVGGKRRLQLRAEVTPPQPITIPGSGGVIITGPIVTGPVGVPGTGGVVIQPEGRSRVSGTIALEHGAPATNVRIRIYQRDFGGDRTLLGEGVTNDRGTYDVGYVPRPGANIEVHAVAADGQDVQLSRAKFGTTRDEKLDLIAPAKVQPAAPEFTRLRAAVAPHLGNQPERLKEAVERGDRRDISGLAASTRWDARALALASTAYENADATKVPADALYALYRSGLPTDAKVLARVDQGTVERALVQAAQAGIIDAVGVEAATKSFVEFAAAERLKFTPPGKLAGVSEFLKRAPVPAAETAAFTKALKEKDGGSDVWTRAKAAGVSEDGITKLKVQGKLAYLTLNNVELSTRLQVKLAGADARQLIDLDYDKASTWTQEITGLAAGDDARVGKLIPPAFEGRNNQERLGVYSEELARRVRQMDPNRVTMRQLARGDLDGLDAGARPGVQAFLANASGKGFKLGQTAMGSFVKTHTAEALLPGMTPAQRKAALDQAKTLSRMYSVSPSDEALNILLKKGFKSAYDIVKLRYDDFDRFVQADIPSPRVREQIYWKAQQQSATVINVFMGAKQLGVAPSTKGTSGKTKAVQISKAKAKLTGRFPTLEALFGSVDYCECDHCNSVLSPAAYLVDILHFIDPKDDQWKIQKALWAMAQGNPGVDYEATYQKPYTALVTRRSDIPKIPLTCENTNTALPYIDIVNEVLEQLVVGAAPGALTAFDTGKASSQNLIAEPQNITWAAYADDANAKGVKYSLYPCTLPFDLPLEMVREFLKPLEVPLWRVREQVGRPTQLMASANKADGLTDVWFERLGLGPADVNALIAEDWFKLYGYKDALTARPQLVKAKELSRRLGVTYAELVELMKTNFINPEMQNLFVLHRLGIDPHDVERYFKPSGPDALTPTERSAFEARLSSRGVTINEVQALWTDAIREQVLLLRTTTAVYDFSETTLAFAKAPADPVGAMDLALRKLNVFVRLQRKLGWDTWRLDNALRAFVRPKTTSLTAANWTVTLRTALIYLSHLQVIADRAADRVTPDELLVLWAPIPTAGVASLYERMFLTRGALPADPAFDHKLGRYLDNSSEFIAKHVDAIRQAIQVSHEEIDQIFAFLVVKDPKLSVANLSVLMRYKVLARVLDVSVSELLTHVGLSASVPKAGLSELKPGPVAQLADDIAYSETIAFLRELDLVRESGLTADALETICRHRGPAADTTGLRDITQRTLLALSALPRVEPLPQGADEEAKRRFGDAKQRERLSALQTLAAQLGAPEPLVTTLVTNILKDANGKPLIEVDLALRAGDLPTSGASWSHYVWFAAAGTYAVVTAPAANAALRFGMSEEPEPVVAANGVFTLADVRAAERYRLQLTLPANGTLSIKGDAAPLCIAVVDYQRFAAAIARLRKAADTVDALGLSRAEVDHVRSLPGALSLDALPLTPLADNDKARATFAGLLTWVGVAAARRRFNTGDRVVDAFTAARRTYSAATAIESFEDGVDSALSAITGWKAPFLKTARDALGYKAEGIPGVPFGLHITALTTAAGLREFADAVAIIVRLGLNPSDVASWSTKPIDAAIATQVRGALKGRHGPAAWRRIAQTTFDVLRKKQRDALVAYLTHVDPPKYGETAEQLFEFLLIDPGSEPPLLASRIQLAISSVQLFVQRCLMNLETSVAPSIIDAKRWLWMSRYRIWEVNRKMFVWPENWLDPEFRDDRSHLFRDLEGALLQGDVSEDLVRSSLYTYLQGLEDIARLEMMTMYFEPGASADGSIVHVIGRTPHAPHKYFYRKCSHREWTPWEPLGVEIDGEHLTLTVWRGRMHLFWVSFFERSEAKDTPKQAGTNKDETLQGLGGGSPDALSPERMVQLQLNWVEHVDGKWTNQSATEAFVDAEKFRQKQASDAESKRKFFVQAKVDPKGTVRTSDDVLELHISHRESATSAVAAQRFSLVSRLAPPKLESNGSAPQNAPMSNLVARATKWAGSQPLQVRFSASSTQKDGGTTALAAAANYSILTQGGAYRLLFPSNEVRLDASEVVPGARGRPSGYVFWPQGAQHVVYQGTDSSVHDLWSTPNGWFHSNASAVAGSDPPSGDPHGYALDEQFIHCVAYPAEKKIIELSWSQLDALGPDAIGDPTAAWRMETLYETVADAGIPQGRPLGGIFAPKRGVVFRTKDNALRAVVEGASRGSWQPGVQLNVAPKPAAASEPTGAVLSTTAQGATTVQSRHIFYRGSDGHVHELRSDSAGANWAHADLTAVTGAPPPAADARLSAYAFLGRKSVHVVYRDQNGVVRELTGSAGAWTQDAIGAKFAKAKGDPVGHAVEWRGTRHVVYRGVDDHVREIYWSASDGWHGVDLNEAVSKPDSAEGDPFAYSFELRGTRHIAYQAKDGRLRELWRDAAGWHYAKYELAKSPFDDIGSLISPFFYEDQGAPYTFFVEPTLAEKTVHDWDEYVVTTEEYVTETANVAVNVKALFPEAIALKPSEYAITLKGDTDPLFDDDVVLSTDKGVFDAKGGVQPKRSLVAGDEPVSATRSETLSTVRLVDTRRGAVMNGNELLVRTAMRRGGGR